MPATPKILELRSRIQRHLSAPPLHQRRAFLESGVPALDALLEGGLWKGGIVELCSEVRTAGASFLMRAMLRHAAAHNRWAALIDGSDSFDPQSAGPGVLQSLLWIRCRHAGEAMRSVDLLLRDGNLPLLFLDLRGNPAGELRAIPATSWYRLQRMIEPTATALVALTGQPLVACADVRLTLQNRFSLDALEDEQEALLPRLNLRVARKRPAARWNDTALNQAAG